MRACLIFAALVVSTGAFSFPENIRLGYKSCSSCHVAPTGGGVLTDYGSATATEYLSAFTFSTPQETKWIDVGTDVRTIHVLEKETESDSYTRILMQAQTEMALHLSEQITIDAAYGYYGLPIKYPIKQKSTGPVYYLKLAPRPEYSLRIGHFDLPYGLHISDHTANIRQGLWFPPNSQRDSFEISIYSELIEVSLANFDLAATNFSGIASLFVGRLSKISVSGFVSSDGYSLGASAAKGWTRAFYSLHEIDVKDDLKAYSYLAYNLLGYEFLRGIHLRATHEKTWDDKKSPNKYNLALQIFPLDYMEVLFSVENYERPLATTYSLMTHIFF